MQTIFRLSYKYSIVSIAINVEITITHFIPPLSTTKLESRKLSVLSCISFPVMISCVSSPLHFIPLVYFYMFFYDVYNFCTYLPSYKYLCDILLFYSIKYIVYTAEYMHTGLYTQVYMFQKYFKMCNFYLFKMVVYVWK